MIGCDKWANNASTISAPPAWHGQQSVNSRLVHKGHNLLICFVEVQQRVHWYKYKLRNQWTVLSCSTSIIKMPRPRIGDKEFRSKTVSTVCRICKIKILKQNYKNHLKVQHPNEDVDDLRPADQPKLSFGQQQQQLTWNKIFPFTCITDVLSKEIFPFTNEIPSKIPIGLKGIIQLLLVRK